MPEKIVTEVKKTENKFDDKAPPFMDPLAYNAKTKVTITDIDKENFLKAFLSDEAYQETVSILGGKYKIRFSSLSVEQNNEIFQQITRDQANEVAKNDDNYLIRIVLYRLGLSIIELNGAPFGEDYTHDTVDIVKATSYITKRADLFNKWPAYKLSAVCEAFKQFEQKVQELTRLALDSNF